MHFGSLPSVQRFDAACYTEFIAQVFGASAIKSINNPSLRLQDVTRDIWGQGADGQGEALEPAGGEGPSAALTVCERQFSTLVITRL